LPNLEVSLVMTDKDNAADRTGAHVEAQADLSAPRNLTPEAKRALAEAEARRKQRESVPPRPEELGGRDGPEPTRFGDWEKAGIVSDF
jgi:hypothetical protein